MTGCCDPSPIDTTRMRVHGCFDRGLRTRRLPPLTIVGEPIDTPEGLWAGFSLRVTGGRLDDIRFTACSCTTLIAYCQALTEICRGHTAADVRALDVRSLVHCVIGVPAGKRDRAILAIAALRSAVALVHDP